MEQDNSGRDPPVFESPALPDDIAALLADDGLSHLPPLDCYALFDEEQRRAFVHHVYWVGEEALFAAVSHVWASLAEPRATRCTAMGLASGSGGSGKKALYLTLKQLIADALAATVPLPDRAGFASFDAWHEAAMASFAVDDERVAAVCARYSAILDGRDQLGELAPGVVIVGPWLSSAPEAIAADDAGGGRRR